MAPGLPIEIRCHPTAAASLVELAHAALLEPRQWVAAPIPATVFAATCAFLVSSHGVCDRPS